jgi:hypothetical protein
MHKVRGTIDRDGAVIKILVSSQPEESRFLAQTFFPGTGPTRKERFATTALIDFWLC